MRPARLVIITACFAISAVVSADQVREGISVGPPKVFDNRSLVLMLEQLESQLRSVQAIDQQKLVQALGVLQGGQVSEVSRALSLLGLPTPGVTTTESIVAEQLTTSARETSTAAVTPALPALPPALAALTPPASLGVHAQDLLTDQVSLTYQLFNLRLLLERALSDRLHTDGPRVQAVLGFQIALDPPKDARDMAAYVEVSVEGSGPLSLVSVMPYEKTYNTYALNRKANAFGGSAVTSVLTVGFNQQRRSETLYLFREADTVALVDPKIQPPQKTVTFGWQFRPVLGRRSVTPGIRQMFAIVALDAADRDAKLHDLVVSVKTAWRKYDGKTLTLQAAETTQDSKLGTVRVPTTAYADRRLKPVVSDVTARAVDADNAVVSIEGENLFPGTQVVLGGTVFDSPAKGLLYKSDRVLELRAKVQDLLFGDAQVSGRYGPPVPLETSRPADKGFLVNNASYSIEPGRSHARIEIELQQRDGGNLPPASEVPLVAVGRSVAVTTLVQNNTCRPRGAAADANCWRVTGLVPVAAFEKDTVVVVKFPFRGPLWKDEQEITIPNAVLSAVRLGEFSASTRLAISGRGFSSGAHVVLDKAYAANPGLGPNLFTVDVPTAMLSQFKKVLVATASNVPYIVADLDPKPASPPPSVTAGQTFTVKKETNPAIEIAGEGLAGIKSATFDGKTLRIQADGPGKKLTVFLTREVTAKPGEALIVLETDAKPITVTVVVQ